jgi:hypothetical protein
VRADTPELRAAVVEVLAELGPTRPNKLLKRLRKEYGASHRAANETMFRMMHDGSIRRTFAGKVKLP